MNRLPQFQSLLIDGYQNKTEILNKYDNSDIIDIFDISYGKTTIMIDQTESRTTLLTPKDVANQLGVSPVTVRVWAQDNKLPFIITPGGHRRFKQEDVNEFSKLHNQNNSSNISILIVDDDAQHAEVLSERIKYMPLETSSYIANDGFEAGRLITQVQPNVILLDLMMPGLDGFSVCERIKQDPKSKDIRIIAMTGYPSSENIDRALAVGAEQCIGKPISLNNLTEILNETAEKIKQPD